MKRHLQYQWWKYLLAVLLPIVIWSVLFDIAGKPKKNERLHILFIGETLDTQALQNDLSGILPQMTSTSLRDITVTQTLPNGLPVGELLTARQFDADIVILAAEQCPEAVGQNFFSPLTDAMTEYFSGCTLYAETADNTNLSYGFILSGKTKFASYLTAKTDCILFFSSESVNLGLLNGKGKAEDDAALCAAEFLLEESD